MEHGFLWNSNSFAHDLPFVWEKDNGLLAEAAQTPFGDGQSLYHRDSGNPNDALVILAGLFR